VGAVGAAVGAAALVVAAAAPAPSSVARTPVKRPAPPAEMAPPRKATKQRTLLDLSLQPTGSCHLPHSVTFTLRRGTLTTCLA
jgi:hypothetical protein